MKILIINQHSQNFGDDAAGCALVMHLLKNPEISNIDIIYNSSVAIPIKNKKVHHDLDITLKKTGYINLLLYFLFRKPLGLVPNSSTLKKWIRLIDEADCIFVAPCGANIGIYKDWRFLTRVLMVVLEGKKPCFYFNTISHSGNYLFDTVAKYVLRRSNIFVRERKSLEWLNNMGMEAELGPDTAFLLAPISKRHENIVSLILSPLDLWHPYFIDNHIDEKIINKVIPVIAEKCIRNNLKLQILPHTRLTNENSFNNDVMHALVNNGMRKDNVIFRDDIVNYKMYDEAIASSSLVVGERYHSIVLAAKNAIPFVALCYENKMVEVCRYTKCEDYIIDLRDREQLNKVDTLIDDALKNAESISERLSSSILQSLIKQLDLPIRRLVTNKTYHATSKQTN